ncbi:MAG TPA: FliM/FliN family flagellar motor switch protein [Bryobacteraceae bacterium]|nr:FliM/FliN family flagellar motor switch protein [Bryobacteraceae bacterium]
MTSHEDIAHLVDIPVDVQVELDHKMMTIGAILDLRSGTVIKMNRSAGENMDILIGGALVGFGEIVIIEESMGVRITDFHGED